MYILRCFLISLNLVKVIYELLDVLVDSITIVEELVNLLVCRLLYGRVADVEVEECAEVRQEGVLTTKNIEIVVLATFHYEYLICFDIELFLEFLLQLHERLIIMNLNVELSDHLVWVVRVRASHLRLEVVDFAVCFTKKVVQSITTVSAQIVMGVVVKAKTYVIKKAMDRVSK